MRKTLEQRKAKKAAKRAKKNITGGLSGNAHDRRKKQRDMRGAVQGNPPKA